MCTLRKRIVVHTGVVLWLAIAVYGFCYQLQVVVEQQMPKALESKQIELVELLQHLGGDIDQRDKHGFTALQRAIYKNEVKWAEQLLEAGADPNAYVPTETPILIVCVLMSRSNMAGLLLSFGANVNALNRGGRTPLDLAYSWSNKEMVELLLRHGARRRYPRPPFLVARNDL